MFVKDLDGYIKAPTPAIIGSPSWWKEMPKKMNESFSSQLNGTVRSCPAINDAINAGYLLYTPTDIFIKSSKENIEWSTATNPFIDGIPYVEYQINNQINEYRMPVGYGDHSLKINSPYAIKTEKGYSSLITHPMHRGDLPFRIMDGIVDTDNFMASRPYACLIKNDFEGVIPAGTPLIQVIPFKREEYSMEIVDFEKDIAHSKAFAKSLFFSSGYKKLFWSRKKFL